jgi:hypothetical protein
MAPDRFQHDKDLGIGEGREDGLTKCDRCSPLDIRPPLFGIDRVTLRLNEVTFLVFANPGSLQGETHGRVKMTRRSDLTTVPDLDCR